MLKHCFRTNFLVILLFCEVHSPLAEIYCIFFFQPPNTVHYVYGNCTLPYEQHQSLKKLGKYSTKICSKIGVLQTRLPKFAKFPELDIFVQGVVRFYSLMLLQLTELTRMKKRKMEWPKY